MNSSARKRRARRSAPQTLDAACILSQVMCRRGAFNIVFALLFDCKPSWECKICIAIYAGDVPVVTPAFERGAASAERGELGSRRCANPSASDRANRGGGFKEEDTVRRAKVVVISRVTYSLLYQSLTS